MKFADSKGTPLKILNISDSIASKKRGFMS